MFGSELAAATARLSLAKLLHQRLSADANLLAVELASDFDALVAVARWFVATTPAFDHAGSRAPP